MNALQNGIAELIGKLERVLIDGDALHPHIRELQKQQAGQAHLHERLPEDQAEAVVTRGLAEWVSVRRQDIRSSRVGVENRGGRGREWAVRGQSACSQGRRRSAARGRAGRSWV